MEDVALMGWGIFWPKLSYARSMGDMIRRSQVAVDRRVIISLVPWYKDFSAKDFDTRFHIPWHPVTLQFPGLVAKLGPIIRDLGAHFGWIM